jgi:hypothetical protein
MRHPALRFNLRIASCLIVALGSAGVGRHPSADKACIVNEDVNSLLQIPSLVDIPAGDHRERPVSLHVSDLQDEHRDASGAMPHSNGFKSDLATYHRYAKSVVPRRGHCNCPRVDSRTFSGKDVLSGPTIFTHVLDDWGKESAGVWERAPLLEQLGSSKFYTSTDFNHNGAGPYVSEMVSDSTLSLAQLVDMDQPGNLFVEKDHDVTKLLLNNTESIPPQVRRLMGMFALTTQQLYISLGNRGQWNHVHIHAGFLFTQVRGSKGWVVAPPDAFQGAREEMILANGFDHKHLHDLEQDDVCRHFTSHQSVKTSDQVIGGAKRNLTEFGTCCEVNEGEAFYLPGKTYFTGWWHGTCDLDEWNAGWTTIGSWR